MGGGSRVSGSRSSAERAREALAGAVESKVLEDLEGFVLRGGEAWEWIPRDPGVLASWMWLEDRASSGLRERLEEVVGQAVERILDSKRGVAREARKEASRVALELGRAYEEWLSDPSIRAWLELAVASRPYVFAEGDWPRRVGVWMERERSRVYLVYWFFFERDYPHEKPKLLGLGDSRLADYEPVTLVFDEPTGRLLEVKFRVHYALVDVPASWLLTRAGRPVIYMPRWGHTPIPIVRKELIPSLTMRVLATGLLGIPRTVWMIMNSPSLRVERIRMSSDEYKLLLGWGPSRKLRYEHEPLSAPYR